MRKTKANPAELLIRILKPVHRGEAGDKVREREVEAPPEDKLSCLGSRVWGQREGEDWRGARGEAEAPRSRGQKSRVEIARGWVMKARKALLLLPTELS